MNRESLRNLIPRLPVFPACAAEILRARKTGLSSDQIVRLASRDQVLAGGLLKAANSAVYTWSGTVTTLGQAVWYLGEERSTQVLFTEALKPVLLVVGHRKLYEHSIEAAHVAERLASTSQTFDTGSAYILGLLHDVGELLFRLTPPENILQVEDLISKGMGRREAESAVFGVTHAEAGADVFRSWRLPEEYAVAVACHHSPREGGIGSALLYLAEQWTDPNGDLPSEDDLQHCARLLKLNAESLAVTSPSSDTPRLYAAG